MITIKEKGIQDYTSTWQEMVSFTENRTKDTQDELWTLEHNSVFTQGLTGKSEHCLLYTSPSPRDRSLSRMPSSA